MRRRSSPTAYLAAMLLTACGPSQPTGASATDTAAGVDTGDSTCDSLPYVHDLYVSCEDGDGAATLQVVAQVDHGSRSVVDLSDTPSPAPTYESHTLQPVSSAGGITEFEATLATASTSYDDGVATTMTCAPDQLAEPRTSLSVIVRTYDRDGSLWECFAAGDDPQGMVDGTYDTTGNTVGTIPDDCVVAGTAC